MAAGAAGVETASRVIDSTDFDGCRRLSTALRGLDDLARAQAARADAQPLNPAVHERAHALEVRLEPPGRHVMRVTDVPSHDRTLTADFTTFGHGFDLVRCAGSLLG